MCGGGWYQVCMNSDGVNAVVKAILVMRVIKCGQLHLTSATRFISVANEDLWGKLGLVTHNDKESDQ